MGGCSKGVHTVQLLKMSDRNKNDFFPPINDIAGCFCLINTDFIRLTIIINNKLTILID